MSIVTGATPLASEAWGFSNQMTSRALDAIGKIGGPRCCKRDSYFAILEAIKFTREKLGISMSSDGVECIHSSKNNQCLHQKCPFCSR